MVLHRPKMISTWSCPPGYTFQGPRKGVVVRATKAVFTPKLHQGGRHFSLKAPHRLTRYQLSPWGMACVEAVLMGACSCRFSKLYQWLVCHSEALSDPDLVLPAGFHQPFARIWLLADEKELDQLVHIHFHASRQNEPCAVAFMGRQVWYVCRAGSGRQR